MGKTKSVVMTVILTIVIVILCLVCVVPEFTIPFRIGGIWTQYDSVVSVIDYGSDLDGGYSVVYYPEGVISAAEYEARAESLEEEAKDAIKKYLGAEADGANTLDELKELYEASAKDGRDANDALYALDEYTKKYVAYTSGNFPEIENDGVTQPALYMEINEVCSENGTGKYAVEESFKNDFQSAVEIIAKRFDKKNFSALAVSVKDGCTIQVSVPRSVSDADTLFEQMGYTGEFTLRANADITGRPLLSATREHAMSDYFRSASSTASGQTGIVRLNLTTLGKNTVYDITNTLKDNETDASLYFYVGENQLIGLGIGDESDGIDQRTLYISGDFSPEEAENVGIVIDSAIKDGAIGITFSVGETMDYTVAAGAGSMTAVYIVFAVVMLAMFVFFIVRYKGLGVAHAYAYLSYLICMLMFIAFLPGMVLNVSGVFAVMLTSVMTVLSNVYIFENIRKEFETGKTLSSAFKAGYKRSLAPVLDAHILLFVIAFVLFFAGVGEAVSFAYVFLLGTLTSGVSALLLTRYYAYILRGLVAGSKQHEFCGFKREATEDDED